MTAVVEEIVAKIKKQKKTFIFLIFVILTLGLFWIFPTAVFIEFHEPEKLFDVATFDGVDGLSGISGNVTAGRRKLGKKPMTFDARAFVAAFERCVATPGLDLAAFLTGYRQLCLFMIHVIGKAVSLGVKELEIHVNSVEDLYRNANDEHHYDTIKGMIDFEYQEHISKGTPYKGAFSCLYLHRTTNFVVSFLRLLFTDPDTSAATSAVTAYDATVGKRHSWIIRKTAHLGSNFLPSRAAFLDALKIDGSLELAETVARNGGKIFEMTQKFYDEKKLLEIAP